MFEAKANEGTLAGQAAEFMGMMERKVQSVCQPVSAVSAVSQPPCVLSSVKRTEPLRRASSGIMQWS